MGMDLSVSLSAKQVLREKTAPVSASSTSCFVIICSKLEATEFGEITQNNGHYAVQGRSRSTILVSAESSYATSY